jgi:hypothetical protein
MRTIDYSLAWKEWNEHKWKLVSIVAVMWSLAATVTLLGLHQRQVLAEAFTISVELGGVPLAVFVGLGIASGEQSRGTIRFLQALPIPMWRVALYKLAFGLLSLLVPILLTGLLVVACRLCLSFFGISTDSALLSAPTDDYSFMPSSFWVNALFVAGLSATSLIIWAAAWGVNRKDEISAGAIALIVMFVWWLILIGLWIVLLKHSYGADTARLRAIGIGSAPLGFLGTTEIAHSDYVSTFLGLVAAAITHLLLVARYVSRFGRTEDREVHSPRAVIGERCRAEWLAPPRRFPITAAAWKQARESGPVILVGLSVIIGLYASIWFTIWIAKGDVDGELSGRAGLLYARIATISGLFITLVVGIGVSLNDMGPSLNTFWRSRPIQPDLWFWTKFMTGLIAVLAAIYVPIGLFAAFFDTSVFEIQHEPDLVTFLAGQIALFAAAVMTTCLVRQAVYAAILSIPLVYLGPLVMQLLLVVARMAGWMERPPEGLMQITDVHIATGFALCFVVCTVIAWLAMRYDWGRKSRY